MKESVFLTIHGRVQGVGFRYYVKQKAELHNISGFVKNLPNGSVLVEAEGEPHNLQNFILACKQGPSHAYVSNMETQFCPLQNFDGFEKR